MAPVEIGDRLWLDANDNGIQDPGEKPISGMTVELFDAAGASIGTAVTDENGQYLFSNDARFADTTDTDYGVVGLQPDTAGYEVRIDLTQPAMAAARIEPSLNPNPSEVPAPGGPLEPDIDSSGIDNDGVVTGTSYTIALDTSGAGDNRHHYDFGFKPVPPISIGNQLWWDIDNDGAVDAGESPIAGVRVELFRDIDGNGLIEGDEQTPVAVTFTDPAGLYLFDKRTDADGTAAGPPILLIPGSYVVGIAASNFAAGQPLTGSQSSGTAISDTGVLSEAAADVTNLNGDDLDDGSRQATDAAFYPGGVLSGVLLVEEGAEPALETPYNNDDTVVADLNSNLTVDFGFYRQSIGDVVFADLDDSGTLNGTEVGLDGVTIKLFAADGTTEIPVGPDGVLGTGDDAPGGMVTATVGAVTGSYLFTGLPAGTYVVQLTVLDGYRSSTDPTTATDPNNATNSDDNGLTTSDTVVVSALVTMIPGDVTDTVTATTGTTANGRVDFGLVPPTSLGNYVWIDTNGDGVQDGTETGVDGVTVRIYNGGELVAETITGDDPLTPSVVETGFYRFDDLLPNHDYTVRLDRPEDFATGGPLYQSRLTDLDAAPTDTADSDATSESGVPTIMVARTGVGGTHTDTYDFGFVFPGVSLGNQVWWDTNNDSTFDAASEQPVVGVKVELFLDADGNGLIEGAEQTAIAVDSTDSAGLYLFDQRTDAAGLPLPTPVPLAPGRYVVGIAGSNFASGAALSGALSSGTSISTAGVVSELPASGADLDIDGSDDGTKQAAAATFYPGGVLSGPVALTLDGEPAGETPDNNDDTLVADTDSNLTVDFGFYRQMIGDVVFADLDDSGMLDGTEVGLDGVTVTLFAADGTTEIPVGADGVLGTADDAPGGMVTSGGGTYLFSGLPAGTYVVAVAVPAGHRSSTDPATATDPNNATDSDDNGLTDGTGTVLSAAITMTPGDTADTVTAATGTTENPRVDFGIVPIASLGNYVWLDANRDGDQQAGEAGINGVTVSLYDGDELVATMLTQTDPADPAKGGYYRFDDLLANHPYMVKFDLPADYETGGPLDGLRLTDPNAATTDSLDSDATMQGTLAGIADATTGAAGTYTDTYDTGFVARPVSIGNQVWWDTNNNSTFDPATEKPIGSVVVDLFLDADGDGVLGATEQAPIASTTTDANGYYLFTTKSDGTPLLAGSYLVGIAPSNFMTGPLTAALSSGTIIDPAGVITETVPAPTDDNADGSDDGTKQTTGFYLGGVLSGPISVTPGNEPGDETPYNNDDALVADTDSNLTVDFGFYRQTVSNLIWKDMGTGTAANNGVLDLGETGLDGVTVRLFAADGTTEIPVGPDGILGTADDAPGGVITASGGLYSFSGLPEGGYTVTVTVPDGYASTKDPATGSDPDNATDGDDNGPGTATDTVTSGLVHLDPAAAGLVVDAVDRLLVEPEGRLRPGPDRLDRRLCLRGPEPRRHPGPHRCPAGRCGGAAVHGGWDDPCHRRGRQPGHRDHHR